jgi:hypothetical protein
VSDDGGGLFRDEALAHHGRNRPGDVMRVASVGVDRLYWALLALVAAGVALSWVVEVDGTRLVEWLLGIG